MALLVLVSAGARTLAAATGVAAPWVTPDETVYGLVGRSLYGEHTVLTGALPSASFITPLLVGAPLALIDDLDRALVAAQALQALVMSSVAAVVFAWARPLAGERRALAVAALSVAVPGMAYAGLLMTEAAFYPLATLALWRLSRLVEQPGAANHLLFLGAFAAALLTRFQGISLLPVAVVVLIAMAALTRRRALVVAAGVQAALLGLCLAAGIALAAAGADVLGVYTDSVTGGYRLGAVVRDTWWHAGALFLASAGIPLVALAALLPRLRRARDEAPGLAAVVAVAATWCVVLVLQVGVFASQFVDLLAGRDLLAALPPLLVVLAAWARHGGAGGRWTVPAALVLALPALALPIDRLAVRGALHDAPSLAALASLAGHVPVTPLRLLWVGLVLATAGLCVVLRRRRTVALAVTGALLVVLSGFAQAEIRGLSTADDRWWFGETPRRWVDDAADGPVTLVQQGTDDWGGAWKTVFWNRRVDAVVRWADVIEPVNLPAQLVVPRFDGTVATPAGQPVETPYAVAPLALRLAGEEIARTGQSGTLAGYGLWRIERPLRVRQLVTGLQPNGDVLGSTVYVRLWECDGGRLEITLLGKAEALVSIDLVGVRRQSVAIGPGAVIVATVDLPPAAATCDIALTSTALVGTTRIERVSS